MIFPPIGTYVLVWLNYRNLFPFFCWQVLFDCSIKISSREQLIVFLFAVFSRVFFFVSYLQYMILKMSSLYLCIVSNWVIRYGNTICYTTIHQTLNTVLTRFTCIKISSAFRIANGFSKLICEKNKGIFFKPEKKCSAKHNI